MLTAQSSHPAIKAVFANSKPLELTGDTIFVNSSDQLSFVFSELDEGKLYYSLETGHPNYRETELPVAIFAKLKAGTYSFETILQDHSGKQPAPPLTVVVQSSFMNKWWFIPTLLFYLLLLFGGAVYFVMLSNFRSREKLAELRNDWTNKLHNDIGGDLSSVSLRLQTLRRKIEPLDPRVKEGVVKTYDILESIQKKVRFVFDLVDPKKDSLAIMLADVRDFAEENFALKNMEFQYQDELPDGWQHRLDISRINKLYLVLKEVINNSVKYAEGTLATMSLRTADAGLLIEVTDNGKGFDPEKDHAGNGLNNLRQFCQEGLLDIKIESEPGKGAKATILVPDL